ncbi:hypothetical protein AKO1_009469 [Acrasis kona]|uniref:RWP-RK domain-containing protein n=1 Tax=Acrasis kona TaxID=1008807 RepID=A0AAW2ZLD4_9EUKA
MDTQIDLFDSDSNIFLQEETRKKKVYAVKNFKNLIFQDISRYFDMPILQAAECLGVSETYLKRLCRIYSITRWPYRRMRSLQDRLDRLNTNLNTEPQEDLKKIQDKITAIKLEMEEISKHGLKDDANKKRRRRRDTNTSGVKKKRGRPSKKNQDELATKIYNSEENEVDDLTYNSTYVVWDDCLNFSLNDITDCQIDDWLEDAINMESSSSDEQYQPQQSESPLGFCLKLDVESVVNELNNGPYYYL